MLALLHGELGRSSGEGSSAPVPLYRRSKRSVYSCPSSCLMIPTTRYSCCVVLVFLNTSVLPTRHPLSSASIACALPPSDLSSSRILVIHSSRVRALVQNTTCSASAPALLGFPCLRECDILQRAPESMERVEERDTVSHRRTFFWLDGHGPVDGYLSTTLSDDWLVDFLPTNNLVNQPRARGGSGRT